MYKTFTSIYLTTGSRVKTAKEIKSIFKIKDGGGLLWSKLSAEIPHFFSSPYMIHTSRTLTTLNTSLLLRDLSLCCKYQFVVDVNSSKSTLSTHLYCGPSALWKRERPARCDNKPGDSVNRRRKHMNITCPILRCDSYNVVRVNWEWVGIACCANSPTKSAGTGPPSQGFYVLQPKHGAFEQFFFLFQRIDQFVSFLTRH